MTDELNPDGYQREQAYDHITEAMRLLDKAARELGADHVRELDNLGKDGDIPDDIESQARSLVAAYIRLDKGGIEGLLPDEGGSTRSFVLWSHDEKPDDCRGGWTSHRAFDTEREVSEPVECLDCDEPLDREKTVTVDADLPRVDSVERRTYIHNLPERDRAIMIGMAMESIRGNWNSVEGRLSIIGECLTEGVGDELSDELLEHIEGDTRSLYMKSQVPYKNVDGRRYRGNERGYGKLWDEVQPGPEDEGTVRDISTRLPNDLTWQNNKIMDQTSEDDDD